MPPLVGSLYLRYLRQQKGPTYAASRKAGGLSAVSGASRAAVNTQLIINICMHMVFHRMQDGVWPAEARACSRHPPIPPATTAAPPALAPRRWAPATTACFHCPSAQVAVWCAAGGTARRTAGCRQRVPGPRRSCGPRTPSTSCVPGKAPSETAEPTGTRGVAGGFNGGRQAPGRHAVHATCRSTSSVAAAIHPVAVAMPRRRARSR